MESGIALNRALKEYLMQYYKPVIYVALQPQMGGFIEESSVGISVLQCTKIGSNLRLKCSVFYEEKMGGCNCLDDPHSENGYCEIQLKLKANDIHIL